MRSLPALVLWLALAAPLAAQTQGPIRIVFDLHCDPIENGLPLAQKQATYQAWIDNINWVLDQTEPLGVRISFLSGGPWAEWLVQEGSLGNGAALLRRLYGSGQQIGSHSHAEYWAGQNDWPQTAPDALTCWQDNVSWVDSAITTAYAGSPPEALAAINCVRGTHLPSDGLQYQALMAQFGFSVRQPGAEEDYYGWYGHHIWHPFRPSATNAMGEDLSVPFVTPTQGAVVGLMQVHHNTLQDMTPAGMKRQFLQLYVNWRHRDRMGLPDKVWCWGWGSHASDFDPADASRPAMVEMIQWLDARFAQRVEPTGSDTMTWDTHRGVGSAYQAWEAAHPGLSSFSFDSLSVNWTEYPYLRAAAEELNGFGWQADLALAPGVEACHLKKGPLDAVLLWRDAGTSTHDLSALVGPVVRVVGLETGNLIGTDPTLVTVGQEPILVTEEASLTTILGTPAIGSTIVLRVSGPPSTPAALFLSLLPGSLHLPHIGVLGLDPGGLIALGAGPVTSGFFSVPLAIPSNPALIGISARVQGAVFLFGGKSPKLSVNTATLTIV
ncbi:MAG: hypothetical protein HY812_02600 [Planctomycetes bacterium]|nr:hypothetical protein [Planctomycetota bacterium]